MTATAIRIVHANRLISYGPGWFQRLIAPAGHARVRFDIDGGVERRVLVRDLEPERDGARLVEERAVAS